MADETNTESRRGWREGVVLACVSAVVGAVATKLLDASVAVLLGIVAAGLFGALVLALVWLRRETQEVRTMATSIIPRLASLQVRVEQVSDALGRADAGQAKPNGRVDLLEPLADQARDAQAITDALTQAKWLPPIIQHARRNGWRVGLGMGGIRFKGPSDDELYTLMLPLPADEAQQEAVRAELAKAVAFRSLDVGASIQRIQGKRIGGSESGRQRGSRGAMIRYALSPSPSRSRSSEI